MTRKCDNHRPANSTTKTRGRGQTITQQQEHNQSKPGYIVQLITCLTADPGVASSILGRSHTFTEIDHEIISKVILLPSADSRRVVVSNERKYVHEVLVNRFVELAREKGVVG